MKKLLLSVFVMCAMYESAWSKVERICIAPAGCPIVMDTGECPNCIDKITPNVREKKFITSKVINKAKQIKKVYVSSTTRKWKCVVGPCDDWIDSNDNLIVKN